MPVRIDASGERVQRTSGLPSITGDWTIRVRVEFVTVQSSYRTWIAFGSSSSYVSLYHLGGQVRVWNAFEESGNLFTLSANTWYDTILRNSAGNLTCWINGTQYGTTYSHNISSATALQLGNSPSNEWVNARLWGAEVWTRALSSTEIANLVGVGRSNLTTNLYGQWELATHTDLSDASGNGRPMSAAGTLSTNGTAPYAWEGSSSQNLPLPGVTRGVGLVAPALAPGSVSISVPLTSRAPIVPPPTLAPGAVLLPLPNSARTPIAPQITLLPGVIAAALPSATRASTALPTALLPGAVGVGLPAALRATTSPAPTLEPGAITVALPAPVRPTSPQALTLTPGATGIPLPAAARSPSALSPSLIGSGAIDLPVVERPSIAPHPTLLPGVIAVGIGLANRPTSPLAPALLPSALVLPLPATTRAPIAPAPALTPGSITRTLPLSARPATPQALTLIPSGAIGLALAARPTAAFAPALAPGAIARALGLAARLAAAPLIALSPGAVPLPLPLSSRAPTALLPALAGFYLLPLPPASRAPAAPPLGLGPGLLALPLPGVVRAPTAAPLILLGGGVLVPEVIDALGLAEDAVLAALAGVAPAWWSEGAAGHIAPLLLPASAPGHVAAQLLASHQDAGGRRAPYVGSHGWEGLVTIRARSALAAAADQALLGAALAMLTLPQPAGYAIWARFVRPLVPAPSVALAGLTTRAGMWRVTVRRAPAGAGTVIDRGVVLGPALAEAAILTALATADPAAPADWSPGEPDRVRPLLLGQLARAYLVQHQDAGGRGDPRIGSAGWEGLVTLRSRSAQRPHARSGLRLAAEAMAALPSPSGYAIHSRFDRPLALPPSASLAGLSTSAAIWRITVRRTAA